MATTKSLLKYEGKPQYKKKRKSSDNVTRGGTPHPRQLVTAWVWGGAAPIVSVIHRCFSSEGHQIRGVT